MYHFRKFESNNEILRIILSSIGQLFYHRRAQLAHEEDFTKNLSWDRDLIEFEHRWNIYYPSKTDTALSQLFRSGIALNNLTHTISRLWQKSSYSEFKSYHGPDHLPEILFSGNVSCHLYNQELFTPLRLALEVKPDSVISESLGCGCTCTVQDHPRGTLEKAIVNGHYDLVTALCSRSKISNERLFSVNSTFISITNTLALGEEVVIKRLKEDLSTAGANVIIGRFRPIYSFNTVSPMSEIIPLVPDAKHSVGIWDGRYFEL